MWGLYALTAYLAHRWFFGEGRALAGLALVVGVVSLLGLSQAVLLGLTGLSPGKAATGLRVLDHDSGAPLGVGRALQRTALLGVAGLPTFVIGAASLAWTAVVDPSGFRRGWHDLVTGSVVVDPRPVTTVDEAPPSGPRQVVNLTAMRLLPAPAATPTVAPTAPVPVVAAEPATPQPAARTQPALPGHARPPSSRPPSSPPPSSPPPSAPPPARPLPAGSAWRVAFDSGESFTVEGLALVGRRPEGRPGEAVRHLVPLRSSDMSISKTHAQFQVTPDGTLVVMDRGSTNGSVLLRQGVARGLAPGRPTTLLEGDLVRFGDREMRVERC